jgi:hypothetical protein
VIRKALDHVERGQPFGVAGDIGEPGIDKRPERFSISPWPMKLRFAFIPGRVQ